jgi:hypothetical protein
MTACGGTYIEHHIFVLFEVIHDLPCTLQFHVANKIYVNTCITTYATALPIICCGFNQCWPLAYKLLSSKGLASPDKISQYQIEHQSQTFFKNFSLVPLIKLLNRLKDCPFLSFILIHLHILFFRVEED